jgi:hypothetical protein
MHSFTYTIHREARRLKHCPFWLIWKTIKEKITKRRTRKEKITSYVIWKWTDWKVTVKPCFLIFLPFTFTVLSLNCVIWEMATKDIFILSPLHFVIQKHPPPKKQQHPAIWWAPVDNAAGWWITPSVPNSNETWSLSGNCPLAPLRSDNSRPRSRPHTTARNSRNHNLYYGLGITYDWKKLPP